MKIVKPCGRQGTKSSAAAESLTARSRCIAGRPNASAPTGARLEACGSGTRVAIVERHAQATVGVELRGRVPVDFVGADYTGASADQGVGDAIVLIAVAADGEDGAGGQDEDRHAGESRKVRTGYVCQTWRCGIARDVGGVGGLRHLRYR